MDSKHKNNESLNKADENDRKPDELGGILFSSAIKIFDPNTKEVIVHTRGDN